MRRKIKFVPIHRGQRNSDQRERSVGLHVEFAKSNTQVA